MASGLSEELTPLQSPTRPSTLRTCGPGGSMRRPLACSSRCRCFPETKDVFDFAKVHDGPLVYCTVWDITKQLLLLVPQDEIHMGRLQHTDRDGTSGILL